MKRREDATSDSRDMILRTVMVGDRLMSKCKMQLARIGEGKLIGM
jgi:hypothetical protein